MRILYLHQYFTTPDMAGGTRSYEMARRLVASGHEVIMITSKRGGSWAAPRWSQSIEDGIVVHWVAVPYDNSMGVLRRLIAFLTFAILASLRAIRTPCDVVFASSTPLTIAIPGMVAARKHDAPFVLEVRDLWPEVPIKLGVLRDPVSRWAARTLKLWAYRSAAKIIALAPGMREAIIADGVDKERVSVVPNGSDIELFRCAESDPDRLRSNYRWLGNRPLLVYVGTLGLVNDVGWLVHVSRRLLILDPDVRVAVIGTGRDEGRVRQMAEDSGVLGVNLHMLGELPKREAASWVQACDASISLIMNREYLWENAVTNKFFDALAAGKPILANHPGFQSAVATNAGAGEVLPYEDVESAAHTVARLLRDSDWLRQSGEASRVLGDTEFNRDALASRLEQLLVDAVGAPKSLVVGND